MYLPLVTYIITSFRQLKNRLYDNDMAFISKVLFFIVAKHHPWLLDDKTVDMKSSSTQLSPLLYFNKNNDVKKKEQMPLHNDNLYKKVGSKWVFDSSRNGFGFSQSAYSQSALNPAHFS